MKTFTPSSSKTCY